MTSNATERRVQLLRQGYHPIPNKDRATYLKDWNAEDYFGAQALLGGQRYGTPEEAVARWEKRYVQYQATGVRLDNGLRAIDADIIHAELADIACDIIKGISPAIADGAPMRYGASEIKFALFVRAPEGDEAFKYRASHRYRRADEDDSAKTSRIEIFGGAPTKEGKCARQMGVYGPHSHDEETGEVAAVYRWADPELAEVPFTDLPTMSKAQANDIIDQFDAAALAAGWVRIVSTRPETDGKSKVYDITAETRFNTNYGDINISYAELGEQLEIYGSELRCSSNFMPGRGASGRTDRCWVFHHAGDDCPAVYEYGDDIIHLPKELEPGHYDARLAEQIAALKPRQGPAAPEAPPEPDLKSEWQEKVDWLLDTRAYYETEDCVVRLYDTSLDCRVSPSAFDRRYAAWFQPQLDKRRKPLTATAVWERTPHRTHISGVRMRPDQPFPLYEENGRTYKNTYRRPHHVGVGGVVEPFAAFVTRFIPDPAERTWLLDWMAHKQTRPDIPGTAVFLVADTDNDTREGKFGTGRGLFFKILHRLYGEDYTRSEDFNILDGTSAQSTYTDWMHGSVLITVDEAKTSSTSYRRGERKTAYEVLKDIVDPAPKRRAFKGKNRQAFDGYSYASYVVATNHANAAAIPENDRRFTVLRNGDVMTPAEALEIVAWMAEPANIGALSQALAVRDLSGFDMMAPLATTGKTEMAELARSEVEEVLRGLIEDINEKTEPTRGMVFAKAHIELIVEHNFNGHGAHWRGELAGAWHDYCVGVRAPSGAYRQVRMAGTRKKLFCFRAHKRMVDAMPEATIGREVNKWGGVTHGFGAIAIADASEKGEEDQQSKE